MEAMRPHEAMGIAHVQRLSVNFACRLSTNFKIGCTAYRCRTLWALSVRFQIFLGLCAVAEVRFGPPSPQNGGLALPHRMLRSGARRTSTKLIFCYFTRFLLLKHQRLLNTYHANSSGPTTVLTRTTMSSPYQLEKRVAVSAVVRACSLASSVFNKLVKGETLAKEDKSPVTSGRLSYGRKDAMISHHMTPSC